MLKYECMYVCTFICIYSYTGYLQAITATALITRTYFATALASNQKRYYLLSLLLHSPRTCSSSSLNGNYEWDVVVRMSIL